MTTNKIPKAVWPYSASYKTWNLLFCSWQIALNPKTMKIVEWWIEKQTHIVCKNIIDVLKASDLLLENVVKTTIFITNLDDFSKINEIYWEYFSHKPARSTVEVSRLPLWSLIEIEVIAEML